MKQRGKTYISLMAITISCKIMGFLRESILAYFFGANDAVDSYKLSESLSSVLLGWLVAFSVAFVPVYTEIKTHKGKNEGKEYTHKIILFVGMIAAGFVLIAFLASKVIISLGAPGFHQSKQLLTEDMYKICIFAYLVFAQVSILNNYLNCNEKYISAGASTLLISVTQIAFIVAAYYLGNPLIMAFGLPASMMARYIFLRIRSKIGIQDMLRARKLFPLTESLKTTARTALPLFLSEIVISANELIDNTFASSLPEGSVSILSYANILSASFHTLITSSILTVFFTTISNNVVMKDKKGELKEIDYTLDLLLTILIPFVLFAIVFSRWGINLVYERGAFVAETTTKTAFAFAIYIFALPAITFRNMTVQYYQAYKKTHVPLILSALNIVLNVALNLALIKSMGYIGLALATTLSYYLLLPIELRLVKKLCDGFSLKVRIKRIVLLMLSAGVPLTLAGVIEHYTNTFYCSQGFFVRGVCFVLLAGFALGAFLLLASMLKVINVKELVSKVRSKRG